MSRAEPGRGCQDGRHQARVQALQQTLEKIPPDVALSPMCFRQLVASHNLTVEAGCAVAGDIGYRVDRQGVNRIEGHSLRYHEAIQFLEGSGEVYTLFRPRPTCPSCGQKLPKPPEEPNARRIPV